MLVLKWAGALTLSTVGLTFALVSVLLMITIILAPIGFFMFLGSAILFVPLLRLTGITVPILHKA